MFWRIFGFKTDFKNKFKMLFGKLSWESIENIKNILKTFVL